VRDSWEAGGCFFFFGHFFGRGGGGLRYSLRLKGIGFGGLVLGTVLGRLACCGDCGGNL